MAKTLNTVSVKLQRQVHSQIIIISFTHRFTSLNILVYRLKYIEYLRKLKKNLH